MCELLAMSSRMPTTIDLSLEQLARHGGAEGPHRDGWGVAFYEDNDVFLLREPNAASESPLVQFIEQYGPPSALVISHIRKATQGAPVLKNTQPFLRELAGRVHVFAHNGDLYGIEHHPDFVPSYFRAVGDTDSEQAFCALLARLIPLWNTKGNIVPSLEARLEVIAAFAAELHPLGQANFLYADADALFVHAHRRQQLDDRIAPPGLHLLQRSCAMPKAQLIAVDNAPRQYEQKIVFVASVPLTDENWRPLQEGETVAIARGEILKSCPMTKECA